MTVATPRGHENTERRVAGGAYLSQHLKFETCRHTMASRENGGPCLHVAQQRLKSTEFWHRCAGATRPSCFFSVGRRSRPQRGEIWERTVVKFGQYFFQHARSGKKKEKKRKCKKQQPRVTGASKGLRASDLNSQERSQL